MPERKAAGKDDRNRGIDPAQAARLLQSVPPVDREAENALLGCLLLEPTCLAEVHEFVRKAEDFSDPRNARLFAAISAISDTEPSWQVQELASKLDAEGQLESIGGTDRIASLIEAMPSAARAAQFAKLVGSAAHIRELISTATEIIHDAYHAGQDAEGVIARAEQLMYEVSRSRDTMKSSTLQALLEAVMEDIERREGGTSRGIKTGFYEFDDLTQGMQPGEMLILAARPSMGKTALALNIAEQVALRGIRTLVFSLEMSREQLVERMLAAKSGVYADKLRKGALAKEDWSQLMRASNELSEAPLHIDDTPGLTMPQARSRARRLASRESGLGCIVIDYLQLMSMGTRVESRQIEISEISRGIKAMARELKVPVLALSQLNRAAEQREGHRPRMSDLRESGAIEQDADVVMMLHREEYYHQSTPDWLDHNPEKRGLAELILAKQRNGPTGTVRLTWDNRLTRFKNHTGQTGPGGTYEAKPFVESQPPLGHFTPGRATGPVENHRDGGGPDDLPI